MAFRRDCCVECRRGCGPRTDRCAERRVARLRRRYRTHPLFTAGSDQRRQLQQAHCRVALQDRSPRSASRVHVRVDACDGERRAVFHRGQPPGRGRARPGNRRRALDAQRARRRARRRGTAPVVRPRPRVLDRRQRGANSLRHSGIPAGRAEREDRHACPDIRQRRPRRSQAEQRSANRSNVWRDRAARHADGCGQRRRRRGGPSIGWRSDREVEHQGLHPRVRRAHGETLVDIPHDPAARRVRQRDVAEGFVGLYRQYRRLGTNQHRSRAADRVSAGRERDRRLLRRRSPGQQPLRRESRRRRPADRQAQVALPARASRDLGSRHPVRADPCRHQTRWEDRQGGCAADQTGIHVRVRPRDGAAAVADRRAAGAERRRAGRVLFADAAVSAERAGTTLQLRPPGVCRRRPDRFHTGAACRRA